jgi:hypothetical protein
VFADAVVEATRYEGVEHASDLGVAPESMQGSWRDVDVGTGWGGDLLVVEEEHQVPFEYVEGLFFGVVVMGRGDDTGRAALFERGGSAVGRRVGGQEPPVGADVPERRSVVGGHGPALMPVRVSALVPVMIGAVIHSARAVDPELWRRTLVVVLDGLRAVHHDPLPGTPPDSSQLARIIGGE